MMAILIAILTILVPFVMRALFLVHTEMSWSPAKETLEKAGWLYVYLMPVIGGGVLLYQSVWA